MDDELGAALRDHYRRAADDIQPDAALLRRLRETASAQGDRAPASRRVLSLVRPTAADGHGGPSGRRAGRLGWWAAAGVAAAVVLIALVFVTRPGVHEKTRPANQVVPATRPTETGPTMTTPPSAVPQKPGVKPKPSVPDATPTRAPGERPTKTPANSPTMPPLPGASPPTAPSSTSHPTQAEPPAGHPRPTH